MFDIFNTVGGVMVETETENSVKLARKCEEDIPFSDFKNCFFKLGDEVTIHLGYSGDKTFIVEHIDNETGKVFFVSENVWFSIYREDIDDYLENIYGEFPDALKEAMEYIVHSANVVNGNNIGSRRKLSIPSFANVGGNSNETGDCYVFDGFREKIRLRKTKNNMSKSWWTDTPCYDDSDYYHIVTNNGDYYRNLRDERGVVPMFCIVSKANMNSI